MSPFQWSSMQRIVAFSRDMTYSTTPIRPGINFSQRFTSVPRKGPKLSDEVVGKVISLPTEPDFKLRTSTPGIGYRNRRRESSRPSTNFHQRVQFFGDDRITKPGVFPSAHEPDDSASRTTE